MACSPPRRLGRRGQPCSTTTWPGRCAASNPSSRSLTEVIDFSQYMDYNEGVRATGGCMNLPTLSLRGRNGENRSAASTGLTLDDQEEQSRLAQRQADEWLISGSILIGTTALGI